MPNDAFRSPWKLLTQLFGEFCRVSEFGIVHVDVLCDDRFDPSRGPDWPFPLLKPERPQQIVDVASLISGMVSLPIVG